jgi:pimeloyl-ACP methyl ester carboxylesterase
MKAPFADSWSPARRGSLGTPTSRVVRAWTRKDACVRIHYEVIGDGPPLVLVHGWGASAHRNWVELGWVEVLAPIRRLILMDSRGHGRSEPASSPAGYGYAAMGEDVLQVLDELEIDRADFFGYSMGAFIGASLLGHHRGRFRSMVLGGIGDETEESAAKCHLIAAALRAEDPGSIDTAEGRAYRRYVDADPWNDREALAQSALQMWPDGHPLLLGGDGLHEVDIPVLLVDGADDHPYVDTVEDLAKAIPGAEVVLIPDTDHHTVVGDPRFKSAVHEFFSRA